MARPLADTSDPARPGGPRHFIRRCAILFAALAAAAQAVAVLPLAATAAPAGPAVSQTAPGRTATHALAPRHIRAAPQVPGAPDLGPNVYIFTPSMPQSQIQATVDSIASQQVPNQFGTQRYALFFEPGTYGTATDPLIFQVGYYTQVAGLGPSPGDVVINGSVDVYNQCFASAPGTTNCIALDNFWRSLSNLTINIAGGSGCQTKTEFWAVAQAAPMRRVNVNGGTMSFMDYCSAGPQFASGGFVADSQFAGGTIVNGSQQQFIVRNSNLDGWTNGVWNQVFAGDNGAPAQAFGVPGGAGPYTTLASSPGVKLSGLIFDAGPVNSPVLLQVGATGNRPAASADDPTLVQDIYFRIGGAEPGQATNSLVVNSSQVILDNIWAWRADHGAGGGWTDKVGDHGLIVTGNDVTAYGLFVEHYEKTQVIWAGQGGTDIFLQKAMPHDPPSQAAWMAHATPDGYPAFAVTDNVRSFTGYGLGSYCFFNQGLPIVATEAFQAPSTAPGVRLHDLLTVFLSGSGGINSVVDGVGAPVNSGTAGRPSDVLSFP